MGQASYDLMYDGVIDLVYNGVVDLMYDGVIDSGSARAPKAPLLSPAPLPPGLCQGRTDF